MLLAISTAPSKKIVYIGNGVFGLSVHNNILLSGPWTCEWVNVWQHKLSQLKNKSICLCSPPEWFNSVPWVESWLNLTHFHVSAFQHIVCFFVCSCHSVNCSWFMSLSLASIHVPMALAQRHAEGSCIWAFSTRKYLVFLIWGCGLPVGGGRYKKPNQNNTTHIKKYHKTKPTKQKTQINQTPNKQPNK